MINKKKIFLLTIMSKFTLARFISSLITIIIMTGIKFCITGNFYIEHSDFYTNIVVGLVSFTIGTASLGFLSEYLGIKGIDFNLKELMFGFEKIQVGATSPPYVSDKLKIKVYTSMNSDEQSNSNNSLDKGKGVAPTQPLPSYIPLPKTNPGPGFNVPGGIVPIRDDICKHLGYNPNILRQFRTMDLEIAVEQRHNYSLLVNYMNHRLAYAHNALQGIPVIPTTEQDFKLKNIILKDIKEMTDKKVNAEGRIILLTSRIQFIENYTGKI